MQPRTVAAPEDLVRYGPGVPAAPSGARVQVTPARAPSGEPPAPDRRRARTRPILGFALAVILLAASGVLFYLRFHHPPLQVTRVTIVRSERAGCATTVAARIRTNGAAGTMVYQWLFSGGQSLTRQQPLTAGQLKVNVTATVRASGNGQALQLIRLKVLRPDRWSVAKDVLVSCP